MGRVRRAAVWVAALGLVAGVAACVPPWAQPTFVVTSQALGNDANPGDRVCEVTVGAGDCTLPAALDEASALGQADLDVPAGDYRGNRVAVTVTGRVRINPGKPGRDIRLQNWTITVAASGRLTIDGMQPDIRWLPYVRIVVEGRLVLRRSVLIGGGGLDPKPMIDVHPGGSALIDNTVLTGVLVTGPGVAIIVNQGRTVLRQSELTSAYTSTGVITEAAGVTRLTSSVLLAYPNCQGTAPESGGYNVSSDSTCGLLGAGDLEDTVATFADDQSGFLRTTPSEWSPAVDHIPVGAVGCGTTVTDDIYRRPRPVDGNADGTIGCDSGPGERPPS